MKYYGITDRGKLRKSNQDSYIIATNTGGDIFAMVCDGIGGGNGGDVASRLAVTHFSRTFSITNQFQTDAQVKNWLRHEIPIANARIFETGNQRPSLKGLGTTLTGVLITSFGRYIINIGDSRTYAYYKNGMFKQLTTDHTLLQDMLTHGDLTMEEAENFPKKNVLTNALGVWEKVRYDIDIHNEEMAGFLICSDGLHGYVSEETIRSIVLDHSTNPTLRVRELLNAALDAGGFDNITAILIDFEGEEANEQR